MRELRRRSPASTISILVTVAGSAERFEVTWGCWLSSRCLLRQLR